MPVNSARNYIVKVALSVFGRLGFAKTTMSDIAIAAKKGRRTIYQYFKNKDEVYKAVIEDETEKLISQLLPIIESDRSPGDKLKQYFMLRVKIIFRLSDQNQAIKYGFLNDYKRIERIRHLFDDRDYKLTIRILREGIDKGVFHPENVELTAKNIGMAARSLERECISLNYNQACKKQMEHFIQLIIQGLQV